MRYLSLIWFLFAIIEVESKIVINEFQPAPVGNEPEWIELFNASEEEYFLQSPIITDAVGMRRIPDLLFFPKSFIVLTKDSNALKSNRVIPEEAKIVQAILPILNNDLDLITLRNSDSTMLDSVYYNMKSGIRGVSFERVDAFVSGTAEGNWLASKSLDSATCGYENSHKKYNCDIALTSIFVSSLDSIELCIVNKGETKAENISLELFVVGSEKETELETKFYSVQISEIDVACEHKESFSISDLYHFVGNLGYVEVLGIVNWENDNHRENDSLICKIYMPYQPGAIEINEIMYDVSSGKSEYIELYNSTNDEIELFNWVVRDRIKTNGADTIRINERNARIGALDYFVIAMDSSIFNGFPELAGSERVYVAQSRFVLNNDEDEIVVYDPNGLIQDSLLYRNNWHLSYLGMTKDISLEKIALKTVGTEPSNWTSSKDFRGGTPGAINSSYNQNSKELLVEINPNPFTYNSKKVECEIEIRIPYDYGSIRAIIYDANGVKLKTLQDYLVISSETRLLWDGRTENGSRLEVGQYILFVETECSKSKEKVSSKKIIVIGG